MLHVARLQRLQARRVPRVGFNAKRTHIAASIRTKFVVECFDERKNAASFLPPVSMGRPLVQRACGFAPQCSCPRRQRHVCSHRPSGLRLAATRAGVRMSQQARTYLGAQRFHPTRVLPCVKDDAAIMRNAAGIAFVKRDEPRHRGEGAGVLRGRSQCTLAE